MKTAAVLFVALTMLCFHAPPAPRLQQAINWTDLTVWLLWAALLAGGFSALAYLIDAASKDNPA